MIDLDDSAPDDVGALLGADGPFAHEVPNFAPREAQQTMARAVQQAIAGRETLIAEAEQSATAGRSGVTRASVRTSTNASVP